MSFVDLNNNIVSSAARCDGGGCKGIVSEHSPKQTSELWRVAAEGEHLDKGTFDKAQDESCER